MSCPKCGELERLVLLAMDEHEAKYRAELIRVEASSIPAIRALAIEMRARVANAGELRERLWEAIRRASVT